MFRSLPDRKKCFPGAYQKQRIHLQAISVSVMSQFTAPDRDSIGKLILRPYRFKSSDKAPYPLFLQSRDMHTRRRHLWVAALLNNINIFILGDDKIWLIAD